MSVNWLQQLPKNWMKARLKAVVDLRTVRGSETSFIENYVGLENIKSWTGRLLRSEPLSDIHEDENRSNSIVSYFKPGDVLFGKLRPYLAKAHLANKSGICTTELLVLRPNPNLNGQFLLDVILTPQFIDQVNAETFDAKMPRANWDTISSISIPIPPLSEQRTIADYLDRETAKLDALIAAKERLLNLLAEKRRALITHAVTRRLNPDVPIRDSGVEWLGEIPAHWEVIRIKHLAQLGNGSTPLRDNKEYWKNGTFPWLTSTMVNDDIIGEPTQFVTEIALRECHLPIVQPDSVLVAITGQGKTRGKAAVLGYPASINQHLAFISPQANNLNPEFLQLFLTSSYKVLRIISEGMGSTRGALTIEQLGEFQISLPPIVEQKQIVSTAGSMVNKIDSLIQAIEETIELLHERRAALIAAVVSGQVRVTGETAV